MVKKKNQKGYIIDGLGSAFLENIYSDKNDNGIRPLLLIYPVIGQAKDDTSKELPMIGLAVVFPKLGKNDPKEYIMSLDQKRGYLKKNRQSIFEITLDTIDISNQKDGLIAKKLPINNENRIFAAYKLLKNLLH